MDHETDEYKKFRDACFHAYAPAGHDVCQFVLTMTWMHAWGHTGGRTFELTTSIIPKTSKPYKKFISNITEMHTYLAQGNICASTTTLLKTINELRSDSVFVFS